MSVLLPSLAAGSRIAGSRVRKPEDLPGSSKREPRTTNRGSVGQFPIKTRPLARMTGDPVAERHHLQQDGVLVAVHQDPLDLEPVARGLPLGPQRAAAPAEERREAGVARLAQRLVVHEADHQYFAGALVLDDRRNQAIELREIHVLS